MARPRPTLASISEALESLRKDLSDLREEIAAGRAREAAALDEIASELRALSETIRAGEPTSASRPRGREADTPRVGLFVDVQNMYYATRSLNARLDFGALIEAVSRGRRLVRAIAYVVQNRDIDQGGFIAMLQQRNFEVRRKDLKVRADGSSKGDWDLGMALEILSLAESFDVVVLATGDGDFVPLVNAVKTRGPRVEVYSFAGSTARELIEACDEHVEIGEDLLIRPQIDRATGPAGR